MSLDHILLGILREPASGYHIKQRFERVFNQFWYADLAQIYRSLQRLEKNGFLQSRREPSDRGPERKVYYRTQAGKEMLETWLRGGPVFGGEKFTYLAQTFFLGDVTDPDLHLEFFSTLREELVARLEALATVEQDWKQEWGIGFPHALGDEDFYAYLTLDMGLRKTRALVEWADESLQRIQARKGKGGE